MRAGNRAIVRAASQASKAADYLFGFLPIAVNEPETDATDPRVA
jgi:antirestriction protein ArdC